MISKIAQLWADQCPDRTWVKTNGAPHDPNRNTIKLSGSVGQNMADSWNSQEGGDWGLSKKTQSWYNEVADFPSSNVGSFAGGYLNGKAVGHYTQVVWAESQKVGCGVIYYKDTNPNVASYPYRKV